MNREILNKMYNVIKAYDNAKGYIYQACIFEYNTDLADIFIFKQNIHSLSASKMKKIINSLDEIEKNHQYGNNYFIFWFDSQEEFNELFNKFKEENPKYTKFRFIDSTGEEKYYGVEDEIPVI